MPIKRETAFPNRVKAEEREIEALTRLIESEIQKTLEKVGTEPEYIEIVIDRHSGEGLDRYTDYILGYVIDNFKASGWAEISANLTGSNKCITIFLK